MNHTMPEGCPDPIVGKPSSGPPRAVKVAVPLAAICFGTASALLFALSNVALRVAAHARALDIALIRSLVFAVALVPLASPRLGLISTYGRGRTGSLIVLFAGTAALTTVTWFLGLHSLPLATATALFSLKGVFSVLGAALLVGEPLSRRRVSAILVGVVGAAVLLNPSEPSFLGAMWVLCAAVSSALNGIFYAQLVRLHSAGAILLVSSALQLLAFAPFALRTTTALPVLTFTMASISALLSIAVMYTLARAYHSAEVGFIASLEYLRLPFSAMLGFLFFSEHATAAFLIGSSIIISGALLAKPGSMSPIQSLSVRGRRT